MYIAQVNTAKKKKKKRGARWRGGEDGTRWSMYKAKSGPVPSVKQLGKIA